VTPLTFLAKPYSKISIPSVFTKQAHQYVDELLLCNPSKSLCKTHTIILFNSLTHWGYWVSKNKAQVISTSVSFMGLLLTSGYCQIPQKRKPPYSKFLPLRQKETSFLSMANWVF
jgi:hypothetical protein